MCRQAAHADKEDAEEWHNGQLQQELDNHTTENMLNFYESVLFYRFLPSRMLKCKFEKCIGEKFAKERISVVSVVKMRG